MSIYHTLTKPTLKKNTVSNSYECPLIISNWISTVLKLDIEWKMCLSMH